MATLWQREVGQTFVRLAFPSDDAYLYLYLYALNNNTSPCIGRPLLEKGCDGV